MTTPRPAPPSTFEEYFQLRYNQACRALSEAEAHFERATLKAKYAVEERDHAQRWMEQARETVERMEQEGAIGGES